MKREFTFKNFETDLEILVQKTPMTAALKSLLMQAGFYKMISGEKNPNLDKALRKSVVAATDPWSDVMYQSLYIGDGKDGGRLVLQEPAVKDPMVGIMVLKAARLSGESGMVFCGTEPQLQSFIAKLPEYECKGEELNEKELLECLMEAAEAEGIKVTFTRLSPEHGGEEQDYDY